jgi:hypothetical protein
MNTGCVGEIVKKALTIALRHQDGLGRWFKVQARTGSSCDSDQVWVLASKP